MCAIKKEVAADGGKEVAAADSQDMRTGSWARSNAGGRGVNGAYKRAMSLYAGQKQQTVNRVANLRQANNRSGTQSASERTRRAPVPPRGRQCLGRVARGLWRWCVFCRVHVQERGANKKVCCWAFPPPLHVRSGIHNSSKLDRSLG